MVQVDLAHEVDPEVVFDLGAEKALSMREIAKGEFAARPYALREASPFPTRRLVKFGHAYLSATAAEAGYETGTARCARWWYLSA